MTRKERSEQKENFITHLTYLLCLSRRARSHREEWGQMKEILKRGGYTLYKYTIKNPLTKARMRQSGRNLRSQTVQV